MPALTTLVVVPRVSVAAAPAGPWRLAYSGPSAAAGATSGRNTVPLVAAVPGRRMS